MSQWKKLLEDDSSEIQIQQILRRAQPELEKLKTLERNSVQLNRRQFWQSILGFSSVLGTAALGIWFVKRQTKEVSGSQDMQVLELAANLESVNRDDSVIVSEQDLDIEMLENIDWLEKWEDS